MQENEKSGYKKTKSKINNSNRIFLSWVNSKLAPSKINDLSGLGDGVHLTILYENLSGKSMGKAVVAAPKAPLQKIGNLSAVLAAFQNDGVRVEISAQDLELVKETMVLGFIWVLIRKYGKVESYEHLLIALRRLCHHYGITEPENVNARSFQDGQIFCAIVHSNAPQEFTFTDAISEDPRRRMNTAFNAAERALRIPRMLEVDDVLNGNLDTDSVVAYISNFNLKLDPLPQFEVAPSPVNSVLPSPTSGPTPVDTTNWEELYKEENRKCIYLQKSVDESNIKLDSIEARLLSSEEAREKLEDEVESLRVALRQAAGTVVDAASEIDRLRDSHNRKLEELRLAEEEKERELATLRQESRALEEEKSAAMLKLQELNQRCLNDEKQLADLDVSKRHLESEIEALHRRLEDKDFNQTTLVAQSEELRSVLSGLMGQLEVVAREEQTVKTRKKGNDKEKDTLASQMERVLKEKKEIEKKHDKAMKELERTKKNRDSEIKKLKKRIEDIQRASVQKMDTSEKDKEIEKLQKLLSESQQRETDRKKGTEEALRSLSASLDESASSKAVLEREVERLEKEVKRLEKEIERLTSDELDEEGQLKLQEEIARMQREHDAKLEEMRLQEEEKNKELERLRQMSKELEDKKSELETQLNEMNAQYTNDIRLLNDLSQVKRQLEGEIDTLRSRIHNQDQNRNDLVVQTEEMKQVLSGLMAQLEAVAKEESTVVGRKKGQDGERDVMSAQLDRLQKEKKEIEKQNERAQQEIERIKKNRDSEIKKLKAKMAEAQAAQKGGKKGDSRIAEQLRDEIRTLDAQLLAAQGELEKKKDGEKRDEETIRLLKSQLVEVTASRDDLRAMNEGGSNVLEEKEKKWKDFEEVMTKKTNLYARDLSHYKERKQYYKSKYRKAQGAKEEGKERDKEKEKKEKEQRAKDKKERKERERTLKRTEKEARRKEKEEVKRSEKEDKAKAEKKSP